MNDNGKIVTSNICRRKGNIVSVDAVRLGSGMGNTIRSGKVSGLPRWAEAAKYSAQWYGMSDSCFSSVAGSEYRSDIYSRPKSTNELAGGSIYMPHSEGRKVPIELYMSFHTDAGFSKTDNYIGPLAISTSDWNGGYYDSGMDRLASRDLAGVVLEGIQRDLLKYKLDFRGLWNRNYGESRAAEVPSIILEMLSHQNFADMKLAYDPQFKFDLARSVYKSVLKYVSSMHGADYVVQPLPVKDFSVRLDESSHKVRLSWHPTADPLEPKSDARQYVVYTRKGHFGFDNGTVVNGTTCELPISPDTIYSYKVCALNDGGLSFPSETLSAYLSPTNEGTVLIVNGFTRLEGPATCNTTSEQGFLLDKDPGVQYGAFAGFCGRQQNFSKAVYGPWREHQISWQTLIHLHERVGISLFFRRHLRHKGDRHDLWCPDPVQQSNRRPSARLQAERWKNHPERCQPTEEWQIQFRRVASFANRLHASISRADLRFR